MRMRVRSTLSAVAIAELLNGIVLSPLTGFSLPIYVLMMEAKPQNKSKV